MCSMSVINSWPWGRALSYPARPVHPAPPFFIIPTDREPNEKAIRHHPFKLLGGEKHHERLSVSPKDTTQCPWPGLELWLLTTGTSALTMRLPCLPHNIAKMHAKDLHWLFAFNKSMHALNPAFLSAWTLLHACNNKQSLELQIPW